MHPPFGLQTEHLWGPSWLLSGARRSFLPLPGVWLAPTDPSGQALNTLLAKSLSLHSTYCVAGFILSAKSLGGSSGVPLCPSHAWYRAWHLKDDWKIPMDWGWVSVSQRLCPEVSVKGYRADTSRQCCGPARVWENIVTEHLGFSLIPWGVILKEKKHHLCCTRH